jgi:hypothetical protein
MEELGKKAARHRGVKMGVIEDQIAALEKKQQVVMERYKIARAQARETLNASDRPPLNEQAEQLKKEYEDLNREIERLRSGEPPELTPEVLSRFKAELRNAWEADLHWLDYDKPENRLHTLVRVKQQVAVLLFIQHRIRMKADLYIKRIRKRVFDDGQLRPFIEDFSQDGRIDPRRFIERWQDSLKIDSAGLESESALQQIIQTLQHAVAPGQTLCLEIRVREVSDGFLDWLREGFWRPLVEALLHPRRDIGVIVLLTTEADLPQGQMQGEWCCQVAQFDCYKYCEIKLPKWRQPEIERWLNTYLNGSLRQRHLSQQDAPALAQQVYTYSAKGVPLYAHGYILGTLLTQVIDQLPGQRHATS